MLYDAIKDHPSDPFPPTDWMGAYNMARRDAPELIAALEATIRAWAINQHEQRFNSSKAGAAILASWSHKDAWNNRFGGNTPASQGVFGIVMWSVFSADERDWYWVKTAHSLHDPEQREYWPRSETGRAMQMG